MMSRLAVVVLGAGLSLLAVAAPAGAHCDTLDGPVVKDAQAALAAGDVTPVLKWVRPEAEPELREAFRHAVAVRALGVEAKELADRFFFETLVRVHRQGEGAPYTGLKPAGTEVEAGIQGADKALESGSVDALVKALTSQVEHGLRERFAHAAEARKHAGHGVEKGREYVAAYVEFMHYAERLHAGATTPAHAHAAPGGEPHRH